MAALLAAIPGIVHIGDHFLAGGGQGYGEAAPGDHLQTSYHLWLFGDQIEHGGAPWRDPYQFQPETGPTVNPAVWPYGIVFWPLYRVFGLVLGWNVFVLLTFVAAGLARSPGCASSASRPGLRSWAGSSSRSAPTGRCRATGTCSDRSPCCFPSRSGRSNAGDGATRPGWRSPPCRSRPSRSRARCISRSARSRSTPRMRSSGCRR